MKEQYIEQYNRNKLTYVVEPISVTKPTKKSYKIIWGYVENKY